MRALDPRILLATAAVALSMTCGDVIAASSEPAMASTTTSKKNGSQKTIDPVYNVCRGTNPNCYNAWVANRQNRVLLYTRTAGPRHASNGTALAGGMNPPLGSNNVLQSAIIAWMAEQGVEVDWTEDVFQLSALNNASRYKAVIFANTSRDTLWEHGTGADMNAAVNTTTSAYLDAAKVALRQFVRSGGGFVGVHNAFGTEYNWPWYEGLLGNANYYSFGSFQDGVSVVVKADASTEGLPARWAFKDEWFILEPFPTKVKFLTSVDTSTLSVAANNHPGHAKFHPTSWCQYYDGGRSWVTTLGHDSMAFVDGSGSPGQAEFKSLVVNGILSAMGNKPFCKVGQK